MDEDRRLFARIKVKLSVKFLDQVTGKKGEGETFDISANGVCFVTRENLILDSPLNIWLEIPDQHEPLCVHGRVVWAQGLAGGQCVGVCVEIDKDELMGLGRILRVMVTK